ncbi:MAG: enoyl-CoA hydratase-related protein, partial [Acidimicrobiales bacterium]
ARAVQEVDRAGARVVLISGEGPAFCAGADLDTVRDDEFRGALKSALDALVEAKAVVMVAAHGPVMGAGVQLAVAADLRVAAPDVSFGIPAAKLGIVVDRWTVDRLGKIAGHSVAQTILLGGDLIGIERALQCGLAQRRGNRDDALVWAQEIALLAPLSVQGHKLALNSTVPIGEDDPGVSAAHAEAWASADLVEGMAARKEKRPARFQGR